MCTGYHPMKLEPSLTVATTSPPKYRRHSTATGTTCGSIVTTLTGRLPSLGTYVVPESIRLCRPSTSRCSCSSIIVITRFEYLTPRIQLTPRDFVNTKLARARALHLICASSRAASIVAEVHGVPGWTPEIIYEPVEYARVSRSITEC
jgi:hypothetical protein